MKPTPPRPTGASPSMAKARVLSRCSMPARILAGTLGAYALTAIVTVALSLLLVRLGVDAVQAATGSTIASFALFAVIAMAVFHASSARRAWGGLLLAGLPCALAAAAMMAMNG